MVFDMNLKVAMLINDSALGSDRRRPPAQNRNIITATPTLCRPFFLRPYSSKNATTQVFFYIQTLKSVSSMFFLLFCQWLLIVHESRNILFSFSHVIYFCYSRMQCCYCHQPPSGLEYAVRLDCSRRGRYSPSDTRTESVQFQTIPNQRDLDKTLFPISTSHLSSRTRMSVKCLSILLLQ